MHLATAPEVSPPPPSYHPYNPSPNPSPQVEHFISSLPSTSLPTALFCVAGGTAQEIGFFADISPSQIRACLEKNYLSAAFITNALLKRWLVHPPHPSVTRHIIFTASTAAFLSLPGYAAYTPSKTATRALADTLRQELLLYRHQQEIRVHCSFPGTIFTESFVEEQLGKPELCKQLEGSDDPKNGLTPGQVADRTLKGLEQGKYFITMDGDTQILLNNMRGPSPRDSAVWEWVLGFVGSLVWPFYRRSWDRKTVAHGRENGVGGTGKS